MPFSPRRRRALSTLLLTATRSIVGIAEVMPAKAARMAADKCLLMTVLLKLHPRNCLKKLRDTAFGHRASHVIVIVA
jgi:hypothetical protein